MGVGGDEGLRRRMDRGGRNREQDGSALNPKP